MPTTENTTSNAGRGVTIVKKPIPRKYQTFSFRSLLAKRETRVATHRNARGVDNGGCGYAGNAG